MGLFDKKFCDVCGEKIGLLGNRKLEDGNLCKDCAKKLSPFFSERKNSTVEEIKAQLAYREANKAQVETFRASKTFGTYTKILIDTAAGNFMVTSASNIKDANPDVIPLSSVIGVDYDVDQSRTEIKRQGPDGKEVSYNPPRYEYSYNYDVLIAVDNPYFNQIRVRLNSSSVDGKNMAEQMRFQTMAMTVKTELTKKQEAAERASAAAETKAAVVCACCGATTLPDAHGCCEYCGGPVKSL